MSEWQPIETAPRDGSVIQVRQGHWGPFHVRWTAGIWKAVEYSAGRPTHWQPLPEPPEPTP